MRRLLPTRDDLLRMSRLAVPVVMVQLGLMAMGVIDTMVVGRVSAIALAGVAIGALYNFAIGTFGMGILGAVDPLVSQAVGANDEPAIARAVQRGLVIAGVLGVIAALLSLPAERVLRWLGQPPALVAVAGPYVHVQWPSMVAFFLVVLLRQVMQALGRMRPVVITIVAANLVNGLLAWSLVFGRLGAPRLGTIGSGIATTLARWFMAVLLTTLTWHELEPRLRARVHALEWRPILRMLKIGLPIGFQYELEYGVFATVALLMGHMGAVAAGAHQIAINIASLTFMVPLGVSIATSVMVGRAVGAGDPLAARRAGLTGLFAGAVFMSASACVLLLVPGWLARLYTPDPRVVALAVTLIPIAGVFQVFDGLQVVSIGILRGVGDTRTPLVVNLIGYWAFALPLSLFLAFRLGLGPRGLWWGFVGGLGVVAIILLTRVRARMGRKLERLVVDEPQRTVTPTP
ncbi:MAG: MATE family efflux transporter [Candidatus Eisenbacteria bacterium]